MQCKGANRSEAPVQKCKGGATESQGEALEAERPRGSEGKARCSAKVQIGAKLLCKGAKVNCGLAGRLTC